MSNPPLPIPVSSRAPAQSAGVASTSGDGGTSPAKGTESGSRVAANGAKADGELSSSKGADDLSTGYGEGDGEGEGEGAGSDEDLSQKEPEGDGREDTSKSLPTRQPDASDAPEVSVAGEEDGEPFFNRFYFPLQETTDISSLLDGIKETASYYPFT